jgi:hypothetical protein
MIHMTPKRGRDSRWARRMLRRGLSLVLLALLTQGAQAASVASQSLVDLITHSDRIVIGTVQSVTDGFDNNNVPYTEVTLTVAESIRGDAGESFSFRQFGLLEPREIDGRTFMGVTPEGWPSWAEREHVMLFLSRPAHLTGLQTTVGLQQGKLRIHDGRVTNSARNVGMFKTVKVEAGGLTQAQLAMLSSDGRAVDADPFINLVRRAVEENWVETGVMHNEK